MGRALRIDEIANDGARLTAQLIATTNHADMNPLIFGPVSALTLLSALKAELPFFERTEQRLDGLCTLDMGSVVYAWILLTDEECSCAYFAPIKYIDPTFAPQKMIQVNDSLRVVAQQLNCELDMVANGEVRHEAARIIEAARAILFS